MVRAYPSGRLHVPIVGPTGRSDWSVRLVGPTIVSCKHPVTGKRKKFIFNAFVDFKPMQIFENRGDVTEFGSLNHSTGARVLNNLKTIRR